MNFTSFVLFLSFLVIWNSVLGEDSLSKAGNEIEQVLFRAVDALHKNLRTELHRLGIDSNLKLIDLFPELKSKIKKLRQINDECYDRTIGGSEDYETLNIFKDDIHHIILTFFGKHIHVFNSFNDKKINRIRIFLKNVKKLADLIFDCVIDQEKGKSTTKLGLTSLTFYTPEEFKTQILNSGLRGNLLQSSNDDDVEEGANTEYGKKYCSLTKWKNETIPEEFDWNEKGYVTPVYSQNSCRSCYVFSTTSALESQYMIKMGEDPKPIYLSVKATLSCMKNGCGGGTLQEPMRYFTKYGVPLNSKEPYNNKGTDCVNDRERAAVVADDYCFFEDMTEETMQLMVMRNGPSGVAIGVPANNDDLVGKFKHLKGPWEVPCKARLNHAVLLVGWDKHYWYIKNSWGPSWGIKGYLHLKRGKNLCGVNSQLGFPLIIPDNDLE